MSWNATSIVINTNAWCTAIVIAMTSIINIHTNKIGTASSRIPMSTNMHRWCIRIRITRTCITATVTDCYAIIR